MNDTTQQYYYDQIKKTDSIENDVDNFWLNLLPDYFQKKLKYGIEQEACPLPEITEQCANWTIRCIRNGDQKKVMLMEDKRKGMETQSAQWQSALNQLTRYLQLIRTEPEQDIKQTLYGAINIGTYTRFYQLEPYEQDCVSYPDTNENPYELAEDEAEIHVILLDLAQKNSR